uniref:ThyX protein n=1 Tax=Dulem virus 42 TaxID=3145760 RepID=A0AAU8BB70_9CAUD
MRLTEPKYEIIETGYTLNDIYKQIEIAGRTCYKSEDKITEDSAEKFVKKMIESGHTAMLEHGTVYLQIPLIEYDTIHKYECNKYSKVNNGSITTNYRVLVQNEWLEDLKYLCKPTEQHKKRHTVKMTTSMHVYKDLTRHRVMSFAIESTRFCNYSKNKFNNELTFITPCWGINSTFEHYLLDVNVYYFKLLEQGWQPQQAAEVLPQCLKADMVMTGFEDDWDHLFNLRSLGTTGKPHPEVERIITPIMQDFYEREWTRCNKS